MKDTNEIKVIDDEECHEIVRKKLGEDSIADFHIAAYEVIPVGEVNGFMGRYFTLKTSVVLPENPAVTRIFDFFAKIPPPTSSPQYDWIQEYGSFKKEVDLYTIVFPKMLQGDEKKSIPTCFLGNGNEIIVLEDMSKRGYGMTDKFVPFDLDHCRVMMKTLARFHARSIVFEESKVRSLQEEFSDCLQETLWPTRGGMSKRMFDAAVKGVSSLIDLMEDIDDQERSRFKQRIAKATSDHADRLLPSTRFRNVLCHGDLWANNILFRYDEEGNPIACCLIDFQLARYNPPAHDILCFLQFTTTRALRKNHLDELLKIYWDEISESLENAGLEASAVFPWDELVDSVNALRPMCMNHGILNIPIMLLESKAASKYFTEQPELLESVLYVDRTPMVCGQFHQVPRYRERMLDSLRELYESS